MQWENKDMALTIYILRALEWYVLLRFTSYWLFFFTWKKEKVKKKLQLIDMNVVEFIEEEKKLHSINKVLSFIPHYARIGTMVSNINKEKKGEPVHEFKI